MPFQIPASSRVVLCTSPNSRFKHLTFISIICHTPHRIHNKQDYCNLVNQLPIFNPYQDLQSAPSTPTVSPLLMSAQPESAHSSNQGQTLGVNPNETPSQPHQEPSSEEAFIKAIDTIVKANMPSKVKLWEPDPFDGSNSHKLHTFLHPSVQTELLGLSGSFQR